MKLAGIPYPQAHHMERMVKRNEKALLRKELDALAQAFPGQELEGTQLYQAACHKQGEGVARMLMEAGVRMTSDAPLRLAVQRGLVHTAITLAQALATMAPLDPDGIKSDHPLTGAARMGSVQMLAPLFALPCVHAWDRKQQFLDPADKANHVLHLLARQPPVDTVPEEDIRAVVDFLLGQGADPNFARKDGFSMMGRAPVVFQAAQSANLPVMRALVAAGADVRATLPPEGHCPHPCPNAQACLVHGIRENFEKNKKKMLPVQWEMLEYLADLGVSCELGEGKYPYSRLPTFLPPEDRERMARIMAHGQIVGQTQDVETTRPRPRL